MLVLSRKCEQSVVVGNSDGSEYLLKVTVIEIRGNRVKLGFEAATNIVIHRTELEKPGPTESQAKRHDLTIIEEEAIEHWDGD